MEHLDDVRLQALLKDPAGNRGLAEHVMQGCEQCDGFLERGGAALDGLADQLLLALAPAGEAQLDEVGWMRLRRQVRKPSRLPAVAALAAVAVLGLASFALLRPAPQLDDPGLKGTPRLQLELTAALRDGAGQIQRVESGGRSSAAGVLILRTHVTEAVPAGVWLQRENGAMESLGQVALEPGTHDVERNGDLVGVGLSGERGLVTVWVVAGKGAQQLNPSDAERRVHSGELRDVAVGRIVLHVEP